MKPDKRNFWLDMGLFIALWITSAAGRQLQFRRGHMATIPPGGAKD